MKKLLFWAVFAVIAHGYSCSFAQMSLSQREIKKRVDPQKEAVSEPLVVQNLSRSDIRVKIYFEDVVFESSYDGVKGFVPTVSGKDSCAGWVHVQPAEMMLKAQEKGEVVYSVKAPQGGQKACSGALIFERLPLDAAGQADAGVNIISRSACLFFLEATDAVRQAGLRDVSSAHNAIEGHLVNSGDAFLSGPAAYYVLDEKSVVVDRGDVKKLYLPPGAKAAISFKVDPKIPDGRYVLVVTLDAGEGAMLTSEAAFEKDAAGGIRILREGA